MKNLRLLSSCVTLLPKRRSACAKARKEKNIVPHFKTHTKCVWTQWVKAGGYSSCFHMVSAEGR